MPGYGVWPFTPPEVASEFFTNGVTPDKYIGTMFGTSGLSRDQIAEFIFETMLLKETLYERIAHRSLSPRKLIVPDRGIFDLRYPGYCRREVFDFLIEKHGIDWGRYRAVLHMVTAAK